MLPSDASVESTIMADQTIMKQPVFELETTAIRRLQRRRPRSQRHRVRFAEVVASSVSHKDSSMASQAAMFSPSLATNDFREIKAEAKLIIRKVRNEHKDLAFLIDAAYSNARDLALSISDEEFDSLLSNPSKLAQAFQAWTKFGVGRGLEKYISTYLHQQRMGNAEETRSTVLHLPVEDSDKPIRSAEEISSLYNQQARASSLYARLVGEADALTIQQYDDSQWSNEI